MTAHSVPEKVRRKLADLPDQPGVYLMRDADGKVIYVGKARSLRHRVRHYFQPGALRKGDPKLRGLIRSIADFSILPLRTEEEAALTEGRLIKDYRPRYNAYFKDDKRFLMIRIHLGDPFPRFTRCRIRKGDGAEYFGPYVSAAAARTTLEFLERRFGLRVCRPREPGKDDYKHCLNDVIRFCSAPCIGRVSPEEYRRRAGEACAFLRGERPELLRDVRRQMVDAAERQEFETAAALRDTLGMLHETVKRRARVARTPELEAEEAREGIRQLAEALGLDDPPRVIECFDISNISGTHAVAGMVCAVDGRPNRSRYRRFRIRTVDAIDDPRMIAEAVRRRYVRLRTEGAPLPGLVVVDGGLTQLRAARAALIEEGLSDLPVVGLAKQYEEIFTEHSTLATPLRLAERSPALRVMQRIRDEAHRFSLAYHRTLRSRRIRESALDEIEGIGSAKKEMILRHFGSVSRLRRASRAELRDAPGIGPVMAEKLFAHFHPAVPPSGPTPE
jgi:excinuclease ABC subunit C